MLNFIIITILCLLNPLPSLALATPKNVNISALVGFKTNIYGYTSPDSKVELKAANAYASTISNKFGYFQFMRLYLPPLSTEICFFLTDTTNRTSPPTCIPTPPKNDFTSNIGPILLAPTITIDTADVTPNSTITASGESIPNTPVKINFFTQQENTAFPKPAQAYSLPPLDTLTNKSGQFTFSLPTAYSTSYKFFASAHHEGLGPSPKSHTLNLYLPSFWYLFWISNKFIIIPLIAFLLTLPVFIYLLLKSKRVRHLPAVYPKTLVVIN